MPWAFSRAPHESLVPVTDSDRTQSTAASPANDPSGPGPWYRRRNVLLAACVVVILAITVITDLPSHASHASNIASATALIKEVNDDIAPCVFAAGEAFTIYADQTHNSLTASDRASIPGMLNDDQTACSFTNDSIFSLSDIDVPGSAAGKQLGDIVNSVTLWSTSDALGAIDAIQTLSTEPGNRAALSALAKNRRLMAADRDAADASVQAIDRLLDARIVALNLPEIPAPSTS